MKPLSVIIPTANQPKLLKTALESVLSQTVVDQIEEVVVSENLRNRESEEVCKRFKELPIQYIFQDPPLRQVQHFRYLYNRAKAEHVAILCDDDWWGPHHLEGALRALGEHPDAVAWASAVLHVAEDSPWTGAISRSPILWVVANRPAGCTTWCLSSDQVLAVAWIHTPFHVSTLVARRRPLQKVASALAEFHPYQDDRMLQVELGSLGTVLYEPLVDTCVRAHAEALTWHFSKVERDREFRTCTSKIGDMCKARGIDVARLWKKYLAGLGGPVLDDAGRAFRMSLTDKDLREYGFEQFLQPHPVVRFVKRVRTVMKNRWKTYKPIACRSLGLMRRQ